MVQQKQSETVEKKKSLNLEVKTLEARIAPGTCQGIHAQAVAHGQAGQGGIYYNGQFYSNSMDPTGDDPPPDPEPGAGVPVIGIN